MKNYNLIGITSDISFRFEKFHEIKNFYHHFLRHIVYVTRIKK